MLRILLPPNLADAAARDALAVKVELDRAAVPPPELLPALAVLQRLCGPAVPPCFLQLTRDQLGELAAAAGSLPLFVERGQLGVWRHGALFAQLTTAAQIAAAAKSTRVKTAFPALASRSAADSASSGLTPMTVDGTEYFLAITLPSREHPGYDSALDLLKNHGFILEPGNRKWWLRDRHKTLNFLASHGSRLREEFGAQLTANFVQKTAHLLPIELVSEIAPAGDAFAVTLGLRAGSANDQQLRTALATSRQYLEADGKIHLLQPALLARLATAQRALAGEPTAGLSPRRTERINLQRAAETDEILGELAPGTKAPAEWQRRSVALRETSALEPAPLPPELDRRLRPYQRLGVAWLWHLWKHALGGILADEMGLGKTIQALALLVAVKTDKVALTEGKGGHKRPAPVLPPRLMLVVAPASLLENWRREAAQFAPQFRVLIHHGSQRQTAAAELVEADVIITSYGTLARDQNLFAGMEFATVIADEAQHIKNRRSQTATALRALRARSRFLLTGTPVENTLDDLRSLFAFLLPGYLIPVPSNSRGEERAWFDARLRAQTAPYILRRTKQAVAPELPAKLEQILWCELTPTQAALYRETQENAERELSVLSAAGASEGRLCLAALTLLLRLRQICCDPRLVSTSASADPTDSLYADSAKLEAFRELLAEALDDDHRVLVFSQFTSLLTLLRRDLEAQGIAYCYLDGSMARTARQAEVDRFQSGPKVPVFLLSLKAGGTGLNLTGADTVVHFDPWWNPAVEAQATDRAHRIGQVRTVTSYKLIATGTVEEKVLALQAEKRALLSDVFEASDAAAAKLSLADLLSLTK